MLVKMAAATPSPPPQMASPPPAPLMGTYLDDWTPSRKSARISSQRNIHRNRTPSPATARNRTGSPKKPASDNIMGSRSPQKKGQSAPDAVRRAAGTTRPTSNPTGSHNLALPHNQAVGATDMLPTPSKTPLKASNKQSSAELKSISRSLFHVDNSELPDSKQRTAKKYSGMSLESFTAEEEEETPIEIFTDSHDRIPQKDESSDNPFWGERKPQEPDSDSKRKRRKVVIPGEGKQSLEEACARDDGLVYVFRGKRMFRKHADGERISPLKGRVLFPSKTAEGSTQSVDGEEEEPTDIEDLDEEAIEPELDALPQTPVKNKKGAPDVSLTPISPPDSKRTTRSTNKFATERPAPPRRSNSSPFDLWPRTKSGATGSGATKRAAEGLARNDSKRTRT